MSFPFNYFLAAFAGAFLTTLLALPLWRKWCLRIKLVDDPGRRKIHDQPVPLAGGLAVLTGILLPLAAGAILLKTGAHVLNQTQPIAARPGKARTGTGRHRLWRDCHHPARLARRQT